MRAGLSGALLAALLPVHDITFSSYLMCSHTPVQLLADVASIGFNIQDYYHLVLSRPMTYLNHTLLFYCELEQIH